MTKSFEHAVAGAEVRSPLVRALGVGIDTTSFQHFPQAWTDVAAVAEIPEGRMVLAHAAGVPVLLARERGSLVALGDRCTHRGAPLHEGEIADGCVICPWHGARVEIRRPDEPRDLRTRPVGN